MHARSWKDMEQTMTKELGKPDSNNIWVEAHNKSSMLIKYIGLVSIMTFVALSAVTAIKRNTVQSTGITIDTQLASSDTDNLGRR
jgi:hypothetical protein